MMLKRNAIMSFIKRYRIHIFTLSYNKEIMYCSYFNLYTDFECGKIRKEKSEQYGVATRYCWRSIGQGMVNSLPHDTGFLRIHTKIL